MALSLASDRTIATTKDIMVIARTETKWVCFREEMQLEILVTTDSWQHGY